MKKNKNTASSTPPSLQTIVEGPLADVLLTHDSQEGITIYDATGDHDATPIGRFRDADRIAFQKPGHFAHLSLEEALNVVLNQKKPPYIPPAVAYEFTAQEVREREICRQDGPPSREDLGRLEAECTLPAYRKVHDQSR